MQPCISQSRVMCAAAFICKKIEYPSLDIYIFHLNFFKSTFSTFRSRIKYKNNMLEELGNSAKRFSWNSSLNLQGFAENVEHWFVCINTLERSHEIRC